MVQSSCGRGSSLSNDRLYTDRAELYDVIYGSKPYADEATELHELLAALGVADGSHVIEAACGTGNYLRELARWYRVTGFDLNAPVLEIARKKVPQASLFTASFEDFSVPAPADALLCLFSSIGYAHGAERLERVCKHFAAAVRPGGVVVLEPFVERAKFVDGMRTLQTGQTEELSCARANISRREGELAVLDFHWLVLRRGAREVEHFVEMHRLWLYSRDEVVSALARAGLEEVRVEGSRAQARGAIAARRIR